MTDHPVNAADGNAVKANGQDECVLQRLWDNVVEAWHDIKGWFTSDDQVARTKDDPKPEGKSRNVPGELDTTEAHTRNPEYSTIRQSGSEGRVLSVKDSDGNDVRRFLYDARGLKEVVLPNGSYITQNGTHWQFKDRYDNVSPATMEWLTVDADGNIHFDNPGIGARVTLTPDEHTIINYWHRGQWYQAALWSRVESTEEGLVSKVADYGGRPLREFTYDHGNLVKITNFDTTTWHTADGGKTWIFTEADGRQSSYVDLDLKVDQKGNVGYTIGGRKITEMANGVNMISPPADWSRRWIDQFSFQANLKVA